MSGFGEDNIICPVEKGFDDAAHFDLDLNSSAAEADAIVLCLGENAYAESPGVIDDLHLPSEQIDLARRALQTGKPVVLLLLEGRGRLVSAFITWTLPSWRFFRSQGALAIARTLRGLSNPSGVLPFTYQRHSGDLIPYDHRFTSKVTQGPPGVFTTRLPSPMALWAWPDLQQLEVGHP